MTSARLVCVCVVSSDTLLLLFFGRPWAVFVGSNVSTSVYVVGVWTNDNFMSYAKS